MRRFSRNKRILQNTILQILCCFFVGFRLFTSAQAETLPYKPPLSAYVDISELPAGDMFEPGEGETRESLLSRISVDGFRYQEITENDVDVGAIMSGSIIVSPASDGTSGIALKIPGVDAFELVTGIGAVDFSVTVRETETSDVTTNYPLTVSYTHLTLPTKA